MVRIAFFAPEYLTRHAGAEHLTDLLGEQLRRRGHDVLVICQQAQRNGEALAPRLPVYAYQPGRVQQLWPQLLSFPLRKAHRTMPFEVLICFQGYPSALVAGAVRQKLDFALVLHSRGHDLLTSFHGDAPPRVRKLVRRGYQEADRVIVGSPWLSQRLAEEVGPLEVPVDVIGPGVDIEAHDRWVDQSRQANTPFPELAGKTFALQLGRLRPHKRFDLALEGLELMAGHLQRHGYRYAIVGDGPARGELERFIRRAELQNVVLLLGARQGLEKAWLLDHAKFFVTTSREEGAANTVAEAIVAGLPVLASDVPTHRELLQRAGCGMVFKYPNLEDLTYRLMMMYDNDHRDMRQAALRFRNQLAIGTMIDRYEQTCLQTLQLLGV